MSQNFYAAGFHQIDEEYDYQKPGKTADVAGLRSALTRRPSARHDVLRWRLVVETSVGNQDLAGSTVAVGSDDTTSLQLADELGGTLIADVEAVTQHHRRDGGAGHQELHGLGVERVAIGDGRRKHGGILNMF